MSKFNHIKVINTINVKIVDLLNSYILYFILKSPEKVILLEKFLSSSNDGIIIDLKDWLKNVNNSSSSSLSRGINDTNNNEERKLILKRFRKLVRMVILNLEWFKALNKDYSKRKNHENLLHEFYNNQDQLSDKLLQQTFNKV
jgi:hypothetical protein